MADGALVHCPACGREHSYTAPTFPCACGTPLAPPVRRGGLPVQVPHRSWEDSWVRVRCPDCGRCDHWPQPEFDCACGALVRLPVDRAAARGEAAQVGEPREAAAPPPPARFPPPSDVAAPVREVRPSGGPTSPPTTRPPFRPVTIRTARDALTAAAEYLTWLGFAAVRPAGDRSASGVDLRGDGLVAQVDPTTQPSSPRDVECLWLNCAHDDATGAFFSLAGYAREARSRADRLGIALFVLDLTGTPQPVNGPAREMIRSGPALTG